MSVETAPSFACESCNREFRWKPAIAGKSAKCGCGATVKVPATEPGKAPPSTSVDDGENDIFGQLQAVVAAAPVTMPPPIPSYGNGDDIDVAPEPKKSVKTKSSSTTSARPGGASTARPTAGKSKDPRFHQRAAIGPTQAEIEESRNPAFWGRPKDKIVPLIMSGVSLAIIFGMAAYQYQSGTLLALVMGYSLFCVVGLVAAAFVSAAIAGISFGIMGIAILRLAAISFACTAVDALMIFGGLWWLVFLRGIITYAIFTFGLMGFFDLEYAETRVVAFVGVGMRWLMRLGLGVAIVAMAGHAAGSDDEDDVDPDSTPPSMVAPDDGGKDGKSSKAAAEDEAEDEPTKDVENK